MKRVVKKTLIIAVSIMIVQCTIQNHSIIQKGNLAYDFTFADLADKYFETNDSTFLQKVAGLDATEHLLNHSKRFNYNVPNNSKLELVTYLLSSKDNREKLARFKRNLKFAKKQIAEADIAQKIALQFLPTDFSFSSSLYFTFGYDIGVAYGSNASLNLAHPIFLEHMNEMKYYSIHELHHAGFIMLKNNVMPSLDITNYREMAQVIEYLTHLEGMATYAPLEIREKENALNIDKDYVALQDSGLMKEYEKEYFNIYFHFKNNPDSVLKEEDWDKVHILSDDKRLWYRVGAKMAQTIDQRHGREKLVGLIPESSEKFITTYLQIVKNQ